MASLAEIDDRVRRSICPTWSSDQGERMEGRVSEEDWNQVMEALRFYANHNHWMSLSEDGPQNLLCAQGSYPTLDGWKMAEGALD